MDYYQDIRLLPDPEFSDTQLMSALFCKLHRALVAHSDNNIGISFPHYQLTLGPLLRLHGSEAALHKLADQPWLQAMRDYTRIGEITAIPAPVQYRTVSRVQVKSSAERLRRRAVRKGKLTEEEAAQRWLIQNEVRSDLPYLQIKSQSNGHAFRLFICHGKLQDQAQTGKFSSYGLSAQTTIPWF